MNIFCTACQSIIKARLTTGAEVYLHRKDLHNLNFWICNDCKNFVGCHKSGNGKKPLGNIATPKIKKMRQQIHARLDPIWQSGRYKRAEVYKILSNKIGKEYHTALIASEEEAEMVLKYIQELELNHETRI